MARILRRNFPIAAGALLAAPLAAEAQPAAEVARPGIPASQEYVDTGGLMERTLLICNGAPTR